MKSPAYPGLSVSLRVGDYDLYEYEDTEADDTQDGQKTVVRYVEAVPNARFTIEYRVARRFRYKNLYMRQLVRLDGVVTNKSIIKGHSNNSTEGRVCSVNGRPQLQQYTFADLVMSVFREARLLRYS